MYRRTIKYLHFFFILIDVPRKKVTKAGIIDYVQKNNQIFTFFSSYWIACKSITKAGIVNYVQKKNQIFTYFSF